MNWPKSSHVAFKSVIPSGDMQNDRKIERAIFERGNKMSVAKLLEILEILKTQVKIL